VSNATSNALVATVNEQELAELQELIATLDVEPSLDAQRITVVYPLQYADPGSLNAVVLNMFRWDRRGQASPSEQVTSAVEWGGRALIVTANQKNHEIVKKMIEQADVESAVAKETFVYQLNVANAESVARTLQEALRGRRRTGRGEEPVQVTADATTNSLIIYASNAEMEELKALIEPLDVEPDLQRGQQVRTFVLKNADPWVAQDAITKLFRAGGRNQADQVSAVADFTTNSVIVSGSSANMKRVEAFITELETAEGSKQEVHVINLENAEADSVSRTLNDIFVRSQQRRGGGAPPISISPLQGSKAVLVKCNAEDYAEIAQVVTDLDTEETVGGEVRVITMNYVDATEMQRAMEETLRKSGGRGRGELIGDVRISALAQSNAVVISGTKDKVERLEQQVRELDKAGETGSLPHVIQLEHAKVAQVLPTLQEMFTENRGGRSRGQTPPVITANDMLNQLIVRASPADFTAIEAVITQLDTEEAGGKPNFRIIQVAQGVNVNDLAEQIETAINEGQEKQYARSGSRGGRGDIPSIIVTPDTRTNSLVVSGSWGLFDEAEELANMMEEIGPPGGVGMRIITLGSTPANEVVDLIEELRGDSSGGKSRSSRGRSSRGGSRRGR
jgi:type II secretory pathway component GspD/PulD (secretin)